VVSEAGCFVSSLIQVCTPLLATVFVLSQGYSSTAAAGLSGFSLTGGSHTVTATYSGDKNFTGSHNTGSVGP
jgi:hypothetical protein